MKEEKKDDKYKMYHVIMNSHEGREGEKLKEVGGGKEEQATIYNERGSGVENWT